MMKLAIDVWTDYVCQYCYIGKRELENAIKEARMENLVDVNYRAYQLVPDAPTEAGTHFFDFASNQMGMPIEKAKEMVAATTERAASLGLVYNYDNMQHQNTLKAHRIAKFAQEQGKSKEFQERLFYAVFTENAFLADTEQLVAIAKEIGLDEEQVRVVANDEEKFASEVQQDLYEAKQIGVRGVPYYVFNDQYAVSGAQPQELFVELLEKLKKELNLKAPLTIVGDSDGICGPDGCLL